MNSALPIKMPHDLMLRAHKAAMDRGARCDVCSYAGSRQGPVPSTVVRNAKLTLIAEAPGATEISKGENLIGPSGRIVNESLELGGLSRSECSILNTIACRPPEEFIVSEQKIKLVHEVAKRRFDDGEEGAKDPGELLLPSQACRPRLIRDIEESNANVILAIGGQALKAIASIYNLPYAKRRKGQTGALIKSIKNQHGAPFELPDKRILTSSYHPAFALRPGSRQYLPVVKNDIARGARIAIRGYIDWSPPDAIIFPNIEQVEQICDLFVARRSHVSLDIETDSKDPRRCTLRCVGLGAMIDDKEVIIVIPFRMKNGDEYWKDVSHQMRAFAAVKRVVDNCEIMGHNVVQYDSTVLLRLGMQSNIQQQMDDTMLMTKDTDYCDLPKNLEFVAARWIEVGAWKLKHEDKTDG